MAEEKQYDIDDILNELRGMPSAETEVEPVAEETATEPEVEDAAEEMEQE